jgi:two-component system sensor histidine kinase RegB
MTETHDWDPFGEDARLTPVFGRLRLRTLAGLRWLAVTGQTLTVLFVYFVLGFEFPLGFAIGLILVSAWINTWLTLAAPRHRFAEDWEAAAQLSFDVLQLSALVMITGGLNNPFVVMLAAPVTIAVAALPLRWAALPAGMAIAGTGLMAAGLLWGWAVPLPLPWFEEQSLAIPGLYLLGLWAAIFTAVAFTAVYSWRVSHEGRRMATALAATQSVLSREQRLSALGALSAAAAHELGTPLATIQLTAKEMLRELKSDEVLKEDAELLVSQARRCRDILKNLSAAGEKRDERHDRLEFLAALEEAAAPLRGLGPLVETKLRPPPGEREDDAPMLNRRAELLYGIGNFVENAVDFAETKVVVEGSWSETHVEIIISDDGPGFSADILSKIGEPYVTTRPGVVGQGGLGLGVFIAKTMIERLDGEVEFRNVVEGGGAMVCATLPRGRLEAERSMR